MLESEPGGGLVSGAEDTPFPSLDGSAAAPAVGGTAPRLSVGEIPGPDGDVVDSARVRLVGSYREHAAGQLLSRSLEDLRAVDAVTESAHGAAGRADSLDVGAALVLLSNLRLYLDRLETGLLDAAQQLDMSWDLIAAILGLPVAEVRDRRLALRARPDPQ
jgi:hypothetical protein